MILIIVDDRKFYVSEGTLRKNPDFIVTRILNGSKSTTELVQRFDETTFIIDAKPSLIEPLIEKMRETGWKDYDKDILAELGELDVKPIPDPLTARNIGTTGYNNPQISESIFKKNVESPVVPDLLGSHHSESVHVGGNMDQESGDQYTTFTIEDNVATDKDFMARFGNNQSDTERFSARFRSSDRPILVRSAQTDEIARSLAKGNLRINARTGNSTRQHILRSRKIELDTSEGKW